MPHRPGGLEGSTEFNRRSGNHLEDEENLGEGDGRKKTESDKELKARSGRPQVGGRQFVVEWYRGTGYLLCGQGGGEGKRVLGERKDLFPLSARAR